MLINEGGTFTSRDTLSPKGVREQVLLPRGQPASGLLL